MNVKVLIVEDNPLTSLDLKEIIQEHDMTVTGIAKNIPEALESFNRQKPDIALVDINLKDGDSGIDFVKTIGKDGTTPVVYLTANSDKETVKHALSTHPASFLTKPYDDKDVAIAIELAFENHCKEAIVHKRNKNVPFVFLKSGNVFEKVEIENIHYLKAEGSYTKFVTKERDYTLSGNLNNTSNQIDNPLFLRIHRSYVVNINSITGIDNDYVFIEGENLPISRSYKDEVNKILQRIS